MEISIRIVSVLSKIWTRYLQNSGLRYSYSLSHSTRWNLLQTYWIFLYPTVLLCFGMCLVGLKKSNLGTSWVKIPLTEITGSCVCKCLQFCCGSYKVPFALRWISLSYITNWLTNITWSVRWLGAQKEFPMVQCTQRNILPKSTKQELSCQQTENQNISKMIKLMEVCC